MAEPIAIRRNGKTVYVTPAEFDPSPLYAVKVREDGTLDHSGAYDTRYECECDRVDGRHLRSECGTPAP